MLILTCRKSTRSLTSSAYDEVFENGRRYCDEVYYMPNDTTEHDRLNILHQIYLILLDNALTTAPISPSITRVLDIGAAPGDWAIAMGAKYPDAEIVASDISTYSLDATPPNISFEVFDAEDQWTYTEPFDLIHIRTLSGAFADWPALYEQAFQHLKPGGWLEIVDYWMKPTSDAFDGDSWFSMLNAAKIIAAETEGIPRGVAHLKPALFREAGFTDIRTRVFDVPLGTWPDDPKDKTLGKLWLIAVLEGLEASNMRPLTRFKGWTAVQVRDVCEKVKHEFLEEGEAGKARASTPFTFIAARKPEPRAGGKAGSGGGRAGRDGGGQSRRGEAGQSRGGESSRSDMLTGRAAWKARNQRRMEEVERRVEAMMREEEDRDEGEEDYGNMGVDFDAGPI